MPYLSQKEGVMPCDHTVLRRCRKCREHGHWLYVDGTCSEEFYSISDGALVFLEALSSRKAALRDIEDALHNLKKSGLANSQEEARNMIEELARKLSSSVEAMLEHIPSPFGDESRSKKGAPPVC